MSADARQALEREARKEWEALGQMSYHGGADGGTWYADLTREDVMDIRDLIRRLAVAAAPAPTDTGERAALLKDALRYAFEGRQSHLLWAEHLEAHANGGTACADCTPEVVKTAGDEAEQREWVRKYDTIIAALQRTEGGAALLLEGIAKIANEEDRKARVRAVRHALRYRALAAVPSGTGTRITHGRHCTCSSCAREDWTNPKFACGMHGRDCPSVYAPLGKPGSYVAAALSDTPEGEPGTCECGAPPYAMHYHGCPFLPDGDPGAPLDSPPVYAPGHEPAGSLVGLREAHERIVTLDRRIREMVAARNFNGVRPLIEAYLNAPPPADGPAVGLREALRLARKERDEVYAVNAAAANDRANAAQDALEEIVALCEPERVPLPLINSRILRVARAALASASTGKP